MRLTIEIAAAALLVVCISATSAAFAGGKAGKSADGLGCSFSVAQGASPAARCAALSGNAVESSTPTTAATSCCRRCEGPEGGGSRETRSSGRRGRRHSMKSERTAEARREFLANPPGPGRLIVRIHFLGS